MKYKILFLLALALPLLSCKEQKKSTSAESKDDSKKWMLGFEKTAKNPIMMADSTFVFRDPITQQSVQWQKADVFNPGAIVRNDTVYMLFRAEDNPEAILGGRTSRIGLAYSLDGINFTKKEEPVLYPENDAFQKMGSSWGY